MTQSLLSHFPHPFIFLAFDHSFDQSMCKSACTHTKNTHAPPCYLGLPAIWVFPVRNVGLTLVEQAATGPACCWFGVCGGQCANAAHQSGQSLFMCCMKLGCVSALLGCTPSQVSHLAPVQGPRRQQWSALWHGSNKLAWQLEQGNYSVQGYSGWKLGHQMKPVCFSSYLLSRVVFRYSSIFASNYFWPWKI